jgi:hypothetical protein
MNTVETALQPTEVQSEKNIVQQQTHGQLEVLAQSITSPDARKFLDTLLVYNNPQNPANRIGQNRQQDVLKAE